MSRYRSDSGELAVQVVGGLVVAAVLTPVIQYITEMGWPKSALSALALVFLGVLILHFGGDATT